MTSEYKDNDGVSDKVDGLRSYEVTLLFHTYVNDETIKSFVNGFFEKFECCNESYKDMYRYDAMNKGNVIKVSMYTLIFDVLPSKIVELKKYIRSVDFVFKFMLIRLNNRILPKVLDYKHPIEMKKYIFEFSGIMPIELTGLSKRKHVILSTNIKRSRELSLAGKVIK